jgi:hypothetical protein
MCGDDHPDYSAPMRESRARIWEEQQRRDLDAKTAAAAEERARLQRESDTNAFNSKLNNAFNSSLDYAKGSLQSRGINFDDIRDPLTAEFVHQRNSVPDLAGDPRSYFDSSFVDSALNKIRDNRRESYSHALDSIAGSGFDRKLVGDNFDDSVIDSIYNDQYSNANDALQRAFARGNLSPVGMTMAQKQLEAQGRAGRAHLQDLGGSVLGRYRSELSDLGTQARSDAGKYELGGSFNPGDYQQRITDKTNEFGQRLEGDIRDATKGENVFDVDSIIGKSGISQGLYNPSTSSSNINRSPILDAMGARKKRNTSSSAGAF